MSLSPRGGLPVLKPKLKRSFNKHMTALGHMSAMWAALEHAVNDMLWELANVERRAGACFTAQMIGPGPRFRALVAMLQVREAKKPLIEEVNRFGIKIGGLGAQRNRYAHDVWTRNIETKEIMRIVITSDKQQVTEFVVTTVEEIDHLTAKIQNCIKDFDALCERMRSELSPWPRTQYEQSHGIRRHRIGRKSDPTKRARPPKSSPA